MNIADLLTAAVTARDTLLQTRHQRSDPAWQSAFKESLDATRAYGEAAGLTRWAAGVQVQKYSEVSRNITALKEKLAADLVVDIKTMIDTMSATEFYDWLSKRTYDDARRVAKATRTGMMGS